MTAKTTIRTLYVHVVLNGMIFDRSHMLDMDFLPVRFFLKYYFNKLCLQLPPKYNLDR